MSIGLRAAGVSFAKHIVAGREKTGTGNNLNLLLSGLGIGYILTFLEMTFQSLEFPSLSLSDHIFIVSTNVLLY